MKAQRRWIFFLNEEGIDNMFDFKKSKKNYDR